MTPERWARVQRVFAEALEAEPSDRKRLLAEAGDMDDEIRREVESLLAAHEEASSQFLESPAIGGRAAAASPRRSLARGTRLGAFEIVVSLGSGGMGEVYRAKDTKLGREVAVKVLPPEVAADPERVRRFEKEARSASALNHPNIVTIHDSGTSEGVSWIAMELVEGPTLRQLVSSGSMPVKRLLPVAVQIAEGLAKAHEVGIVHRDLKPENVMVTRDGLVKILDFGLAKLSGPVSGSGEHSQMPTASGTSPGMILGTVGYMSPEQAAGNPVDYRSDQFSFGSILYEMATGRRAFQKKTAVDTLSAILNEEPEPVGSVNSQAPAPLRWIVERCLAKEPEARYVSTRDLARELASVHSHLSDAISGTTPARETSKAPTRRALIWLPVAGLLVGLGVLATQWLGRDTPRIPSFRQITFRRGNLLTSRFAPDGRTVVYGAAWDGAPSEIFTVRTDSPVSRPIGLSRADVMSVSSKGELAVLIRKSNEMMPKGTGILARVPMAGGTPRELLESVLHADWAPNGEDLAVVRYLDNGKYRLEYPIGTVLAEQPNDFGVFVRVSPSGEQVAAMDGDKLVTYDRKGARKTIASGWMGGSFAWSPRDELVYNGGRNEEQYALYAVGRDGRERVLMSNILPFFITDIASDGRVLLEHAWGRGGIVCAVGGSGDERELGWLGGSMVRLIAPDASFVIFEEIGIDPGGIYLRKADGTPAVRLGNGTPQDISADGKWVLTLQSGSPATLVMIPTGSGSSRKIETGNLNPRSAWLLGESNRILFETDPDASGNPVLAVVGRDGGSPTRLRTEGLVADNNLAVSSDGERFGYLVADRHLRLGSVSGGPPMTVPGGALGDKQQLLTWTADGRFLYLWTAGTVPAQIERLELSTGRRMPWKKLMPKDPAGITEISSVVVAPDGLSYAYTYVRSLISDLYIGKNVL